MNFKFPLIGSMLVGYANNVLAANTDEQCKLPTGPYVTTCTNIAIEYCANYKDSGNPCKFTANCFSDSNGGFNNYEIMLPQHITYLNVRNEQGNISHPEIYALIDAQKAKSPIECEPCKLPTGNYNESCQEISITYLDQYKDSQKPCLFIANCDTLMRKHSSKNRHVGHTKYIHNEILLPKNVLFSGVKNLDGRLIHPSDQLQVATDFCYESGSTKEIVICSGSSNDFTGKEKTGAVLATALVLAFLG